jgi:Putative redox-active protein (C_GCAxxG_C_C)/FlgD Ig-like domain
MNQHVTRKEFLKTGARYAAGVAVGAGVVNMVTHSNMKAGGLAYTWPWPYQTLDVEAVRILGHDAYWAGKGCSYGSFHAIATKLREVLPDPWDALPSEIMLYGGGGGAGWGTLCGALNGPAALISLVVTSPRSNVLNSELFGWYTQTLFPTDTSNQYAANHTFTDNRCDVALAQNASGSPLCHASVTEWCKASGITQDDLKRKERCARVTGDVAAFAAHILNEEFAGTFAATYVPPATIADCMSCHGVGTMNTVAAKMDCVQCHGDPHASTSVKQIEEGASSYRLKQNYPNPFNPSTNIQFSVPRQEYLNLSIYDAHGRLVKVLVDQTQYAPGAYTIEWNGTNGMGQRVASGSYFARMQAGSHQSTIKLSLVK